LAFLFPHTHQLCGPPCPAPHDVGTSPVQELDAVVRVECVV
jgi:hypothetical protein